MVSPHHLALVSRILLSPHGHSTHALGTRGSGGIALGRQSDACKTFWLSCGEAQRLLLHSLWTNSAQDLVGEASRADALPSQVPGSAHARVSRLSHCSRSFLPDPGDLRLLQPSSGQALSCALLNRFDQLETVSFKALWAPAAPGITLGKRPSLMTPALDPSKSAEETPALGPPPAVQSGQGRPVPIPGPLGAQRIASPFRDSSAPYVWTSAPPLSWVSSPPLRSFSSVTPEHASSSDVSRKSLGTSPSSADPATGERGLESGQEGQRSKGAEGEGERRGRGSPPKRVVVYRGKWMRLFRLLVRFKVGQLAAVGATAVPIAYWTQGGALAPADLALIGAVVGGALAASWALWYYSCRYIGELALLPPSTVIISTLDFWGNRQNKHVDIRDLIPPFQGLSNHEIVQAASAVFVPLDVEGETQYVLSLKHGRLMDKELLLALLKGDLELEDTRP